MTEFSVPQYPDQSLGDLRFRRNRWLSNPGQRRYDLFLARSAIFLSVRAIKDIDKKVVLVPAYVCRTAIDPIVATGASIQFYSVNRHCEVSLEDIERRIGTETAALLVVHHFGFPAPVQQLRRLCDEKNIVMIEDCAHVLTGSVAGKPLGTFGDVGIFSWRKFLPVYDGASLIVNRRTFEVDAPLSSLPQKASARCALHVLSGVRSVAKVKRKLNVLLRRGTGATVSTHVGSRPSVDIFDANTDDFCEAASGYEASWASSLVLRQADLQKISTKRRANYEYLVDRIASCAEISPLRMSPPPGGAAWVFPIVVEGHENPHSFLRERGIPATAWDQVKPEQIDSRDADARFLYHHVAFLPVHQDLTPDHLERIADACQMLSRSSARSPA